MDPTHNVEAGDRHVRVAVGRDYADVPPTRGTFKGTTASRLAVSVEVIPATTMATVDRAAFETAWTAEAAPTPTAEQESQQQQQQ
jgi:transglutaminase-like putative cysteine protease